MNIKFRGRNNMPTNDGFDDDFDDASANNPNDEQVNKYAGAAAAAVSSVMSGGKKSRYDEPQDDDLGALLKRQPKPQIDAGGRRNLDNCYVPGVSDTEIRQHARYKRRNKKPLRMWAKATITGVCLFFGFVLLMGFMAWRIMIGQLNIVDSTGGRVQVQVSQEEHDSVSAEVDTGGEDNSFVVTDIPEMSDKDVQLVLLLGSDARPNKGVTARSDTIMLLAIDRKHQKLKLISLLRDCYARIPGWKPNKINTAFYYDTFKGNADLSIMKKTLQTNLGVSIDNFVVVDFTSFSTIVDMIGGVNMEVSDAEAKYMRSDPKYGKFPRYTAAGTYCMNGPEALNYVRMRKVSGQTDFNRTERQRTMLNQIIKQVKNMAYLDMAQLMYAVFPYVTTDFTEAQLLGLVTEAGTIMSYDMVQFTIPIDGTWKYGTVVKDTGQMSVIFTNYTFNATELQKFIYDNDMTYVGGKKAEGVSVPTAAVAANITTTTTGAQSETTTRATTTSTTTTTTATTTTTTTTKAA